EHVEAPAVQEDAAAFVLRRRREPGERILQVHPGHEHARDEGEGPDDRHHRNPPPPPVDRRALPERALAVRHEDRGDRGDDERQDEPEDAHEGLERRVRPGRQHGDRARSTDGQDQLRVEAPGGVRRAGWRGLGAAQPKPSISRPTTTSATPRYWFATGRSPSRGIASAIVTRGNTAEATSTIETNPAAAPAEYATTPRRSAAPTSAAAPAPPIRAGRTSGRR